jgi:hypothetical protein
MAGGTSFPAPLPPLHSHVPSMFVALDLCPTPVTVLRTPVRNQFGPSSDVEHTQDNCFSQGLPTARPAGGGVSYLELGFTNEHHSQTHHNNEPEKVRKVAAITAFNIAQFAYMVKKMHGVREGEGTLLDNCIMMWGSGLEDGNKHARENLPFIIAGKGGGSINTGRYLPDTKGNQGDLLTTLLTCAGIPVDRPVGIATKQLREMTVRL